MDRIPFHPPGENNARLGQLDSDSPKSWSPRKLEEWKTKYNTLRYIMEGDKNPRPYDCGWCGAAQDNLRGLVVHVNAKHARLGDKEHWKKWESCNGRLGRGRIGAFAPSRGRTLSRGRRAEEYEGILTSLPFVVSLGTEDIYANGRIARNKRCTKRI